MRQTKSLVPQEDPQKFERTYYVARWKTLIDGKTNYAKFGAETGMGRVIDMTANINSAEQFSSPEHIMSTLGGHYRGYEAVPVMETTVRTVCWPVPFPDPKVVFDR